MTVRELERLAVGDRVALASWAGTVVATGTGYEGHRYVRVRWDEHSAGAYWQWSYFNASSSAAHGVRRLRRLAAGEVE